MCYYCHITQASGQTDMVQEEGFSIYFSLSPMFPFFRDTQRAERKEKGEESVEKAAQTICAFLSLS